MNRGAITFTSLVLTFACLLFLAEVRGTINGAKEHKELAKFWKSKVAREQLKKLIALGKVADFKQDVALLLPEKIKGESIQARKQKLRDLASVIPHENQMEINLSLSASKMLAQGKEHIKKRRYDEGIKVLEKMISEFPDSHHVVEAHYLIIEGFFNQEKNIPVITWVERMVELFPENRLTGYALLKVGGLYEIDGRKEDAIKIYKTIVAVYSDKNLIDKAQVAVGQLKL